MNKIGRYDIVAELGRGAMGIVYRASDPTTGREVALKVLSPIHSPEEGFDSPQQMLMREVSAAARLAHPSIVAIHDAFKDEETQSICIAMEMVPGVTLEKMLESSPPATTEETLNIARQVAEGLDYAHRNQVIHRDLKPANILVTLDGRAKITDFGIAKVLSREGVAHTIGVVGTPSCMSPEQVKGAEVDARTDIFSLGIIIFTMLVGKQPFTGNTAAVMFKIVFEEPPAPSSLNPELTSAHDYVVKKCLAKDVNRRYSSANELLGDLDDIEHGRPPRSQAAVPGPAPAAAPRLDRTVPVPAPGLAKPATPPPPRSSPPTPPRAQPMAPPRPAAPPPAAAAKPESLGTTPPPAPRTLAIPASELAKGASQMPPPLSASKPPISAPAQSPKPVIPPPVAPPQVNAPLPAGQTPNMPAAGLSAVRPSAPPTPPSARVPSALGGATMIGQALPQEPQLFTAPPQPSSPPRPVPGPPPWPQSPSMGRPMPTQAAGIPVPPPAAGPQPPTALPPSQGSTALGVEPAAVPAAVSPTPKSNLVPLALGGLAVVLLAAASLGYWWVHRSGNVASRPAQVAVQTTPAPPSPAPAPEAVPAPAESPTPPPAEATEQAPPPVTPAPEVAKRTPVRKPKLTTTPQPAAPEPTPQPAVVAPSPQPEPSAPSPEDIAKAEAARLATIPRVIQVACNYGMKDATLVFSAGGKPLFEQTLKGKKVKGGFLGIKGSYQGTITHDITVPAGTSEVTVRVYAKDGAIDLTKPIKMPPSGGFVPTLSVEVDSEHLSLNWKGSSAAK